MCCGESDRRAASAGAADQRDALQLELVEESAQCRDLPLYGQVRLTNRAVRHADTESVVADEGVSARDAVPEPSEAVALPIQFEVADPPRGGDERRPVSALLVRHAPGVEWKEPDLGVVEHRDEPTTATRRFPCLLYCQS